MWFEKAFELRERIRWCNVYRLFKRFTEVLEQFTLESSRWTVHVALQDSSRSKSSLETLQALNLIESESSGKDAVRFSLTSSTHVPQYIHRKRAASGRRNLDDGLAPFN